MNKPTTTPITWKNEGGAVRVLPARGRVLNIETGSERALWNPEAPPFAWCLGGERLWFGPEADWHWQKLGPPDFDYYEVAPALDPDLWTVSESGDGFFSAAVEPVLRCAHREAFVKLRVTRSVELLRADTLAAPEGGIGLCARTELEILDGTPGQAVDLWSILQVPFGGKMLVPTVGRPTPRDHFNPTPASEITTHATHAEIAIRGAAKFKVGIPPKQSVGRAAYVRRVPDGWLVLARSHPVHAELRYCDAPLDALGTQGDALQFFCDDGEQGAFGELEHHSRALFCGEGPRSLSETTVTRVMTLDDEAFAEWKSRFLGTA